MKDGGADLCRTRGTGTGTVQGRHGHSRRDAQAAYVGTHLSPPVEASFSRCSASRALSARHSGRSTAKVLHCPVSHSAARGPSSAGRTPHREGWAGQVGTQCKEAMPRWATGVRVCVCVCKCRRLRPCTCWKVKGPGSSLSVPCPTPPACRPSFGLPDAPLPLPRRQHRSSFGSSWETAPV